MCLWYGNMPVLVLLIVLLCNDCSYVAPLSAVYAILCDICEWIMVILYLQIVVH